MKEPVGRVYVLTNPRMVGVVKIGFTLGTVEGRAKELDATGTPEPFEIAYQIEVRGPEALERATHQRLKRQRIRNSREFFEVDVLDAISTIREIAVDTLDEEINSKYIALVDEAEKRRLSQKLADERAKEQRYEKLQKFRYENFLEKSQAFQLEKNRLHSELNFHKEKLSEQPEIIKLNWIEVRGVELLKLAFWISTFFTLYYVLLGAWIQSILFIILDMSLFYLNYKITCVIRNKEKKNLVIKNIQNEIKGIEYDIERLDKNKPKLEGDLVKFARFDVIKLDENGFEKQATISGRAEV